MCIKFKETKREERIEREGFEHCVSCVGFIRREMFNNWDYINLVTKIKKKLYIVVI